MRLIAPSLINPWENRDHFAQSSLLTMGEQGPLCAEFSPPLLGRTRPLFAQRFPSYVHEDGTPTARYTHREAYTGRYTSQGHIPGYIRRYIPSRVASLGV